MLSIGLAHVSTSQSFVFTCGFLGFGCRVLPVSKSWRRPQRRASQSLLRTVTWRRAVAAFSSCLATTASCTSSGPSAKRKERAATHALASTKSCDTPPPPKICRQWSMADSHALGTAALMSATSCTVRADLRPLRTTSPLDDGDPEAPDDASLSRAAAAASTSNRLCSTAARECASCCLTTPKSPRVGRPKAAFDGSTLRSAEI